MSSSGNSGNNNNSNNSNTSIGTNVNSKKKPKPRLFTKDVKALLYAYGDVEEPLPETVNAVEDLLVNYVVDLCHDAHAYSKVTLRQKVRVEDFKFALRKDPYKYGRLEELLLMQKKIESARKQFDNTEGKNFKSMAVDDDDEDAQNDEANGVVGQSTGTNSASASNNSTGTSDRKPTKKNKKDDNRPKRKYTKSGKERKPYKKRAKKGENTSQGPIIKAAAPSSSTL